MGRCIDKLIGIAGPSIVSSPPTLEGREATLAGLCADEILYMLAQRNGYYALEAALHVFPSQTKGSELGLHDWNAERLWRADFDDMAANCLFFAENVFGEQFCVRDGFVNRFDPETGNHDRLADTLENWSDRILKDYEFLTGYPLAHDWQVKNGMIPPGHRLLPKVPFVAGGEFTVDNLHLVEAVRGMRARAGIAIQLRDLPDGAQIEFQVTELDIDLPPS